MAKEQNKSFVLRIDAETMEAVEKWAEDEFRSTNGQIQWIISEALRKRGICKADSLMQLKALQTLKELEFFASALFLSSE